jgi:hypothetical protein
MYLMGFESDVGEEDGGAGVALGVAAAGRLVVRQHHVAGEQDL